MRAKKMWVAITALGFVISVVGFILSGERWFFMPAALNLSALIAWAGADA